MKCKKCKKDIKNAVRITRHGIRTRNYCDKCAKELLNSELKSIKEDIKNIKESPILSAYTLLKLFGKWQKITNNKYDMLVS